MPWIPACAGMSGTASSAPKGMRMPETTADRLAAYRAKFSLDGKTALVLGAASGIGRASAEAMAALGAHVICADQNREQVEAVAADLKRTGRRRRGACRRCRQVGRHRRAGRRDPRKTQAPGYRRDDAGDPCAQADAGLYGRGVDRVADLNLRGTFYFLRAFGRIMSAQRGGSLIASSWICAQRHWRPGLGGSARSAPLRRGIRARSVQCPSGRRQGAW